jgi:hypothetical protein
MVDLAEHMVSHIPEHHCGSHRQGHGMDFLWGLEEFQGTVSRQTRTEQKIIDDYSIEQTLYGVWVDKRTAPGLFNEILHLLSIE